MNLLKRRVAGLLLACAAALSQAALSGTWVPAHHWWVAGRDEGRRGHATQIGAGARHAVLAGGHYELLRQAALLTRLEHLLAEQPERA